ncbi:MAG: deoxyribonuclease IV [Planctomycetes bacterium]|nr:deoxyribonuclease IV [Planctomycetota bacterium]
MLFGAHMSISGGLEIAFDRAESAGCEALQIFTKSTGMWKARPLTEEEVRSFRARAAAARPMPVLAHAAYLINIASPNKALREKSIQALFIELERCEALAIPGLVLHTGAHMGAGEEAGIKNLIASLDALHARARGFRSGILLETSAGQGSSVGWRFGDLGRVLEAVKEPERLGFCVDTCHIFAAGYDIRTRWGYRAAMEELDGAVGLERVRCIHANDSKKDLGSRVDRHEHIGKGYIGLEGFKHFIDDRRFKRLPYLLETPKEDRMDEVNLAVLKKLGKN